MQANSLFRRTLTKRVLGRRYWPIYYRALHWQSILWRWTWRCEACGAMWGVRKESSRTAYHWGGKGRDPNRDLKLCRGCAIEHHEHWNERWAEYYEGLL